MICKFTCYACFVSEADFEVPDREHDEELGDWLDKRVRPAMRSAHLRRSPDCTAEHADLKIPFAEGRPVGSPVLN